MRGIFSGERIRAMVQSAPSSEQGLIVAQLWSTVEEIRRVIEPTRELGEVIVELDEAGKVLHELSVRVNRANGLSPEAAEMFSFGH